jgi:hypothetical protein
MPARGGKPAQDAFAPRLLVQVEGLRVELAREGDDLPGRHELGAEREADAGRKSSKA